MPKRPKKLVMFRVSEYQMLMGCRDGGKNYPLGSEGLVVSGKRGKRVFQPGGCAEESYLKNFQKKMLGTFFPILEHCS